MIDSNTSEDCEIYILKFLSTQKISSAGDIKTNVYKTITLFKGDRKILNGRESEPKIHNTIQNALRPNQRLRKTGLIERIGDNIYEITPAGTAYLEKFSESMEVLNDLFPDDFD